MNLFSVKRTINGKTFLRDEDRISAVDWKTADFILQQGISSGRFDTTCQLDGIIVHEEEITDDQLLDIMIDNKLIKCV